MPQRPELVTAGAQACYSPPADRVTMPARELFTTAAEYYSTLLHELTHSTGIRPGWSATRSPNRRRSEHRPTRKRNFAPKWITLPLRGSRDQRPRDRDRDGLYRRLAGQASGRSQAAGSRGRPGAVSSGFHPRPSIHHRKLGDNGAVERPHQNISGYETINVNGFCNRSTGALRGGCKPDGSDARAFIEQTVQPWIGGRFSIENYQVLKADYELDAPGVVSKFTYDITAKYDIALQFGGGNPDERDLALIGCRTVTRANFNATYHSASTVEFSVECPSAQGVRHGVRGLFISATDYTPAAQNTLCEALNYRVHIATGLYEMVFAL
jgi:Zincin-like metallopeptidase